MIGLHRLENAIADLRADLARARAINADAERVIAERDKLLRDAVAMRAAIDAILADVGDARPDAVIVVPLRLLRAAKKAAEL